jgi:intracellular sulfur oxidation DsrE/DsrF family protein
MKKDDVLSEEQLNAFIDGELDAEEENRIFALAESSPEMDVRLCQQRKLKEMVQHAYRDLPRAGKRGVKHKTGNHLLRLSLAAMLLLATGVTVGWFAARLMGPGQAEPSLAAVPAQAQTDSYLLHVSTSDQERMEQALRRAEEIMSGPEATNSTRVEIVANEGGLDLLRSDVTPFTAEIRQLAQQNVLFFACSRAIERLERMGIDVQLLPEANSDYSALDRVVMRMQQGWEYIKI